VLPFVPGPNPPADGRDPLAPFADAPLLLPLNRCHPPALELVEPVDEFPWLMLSEPDEVDGLTRCHPPLAPDEPALCDAGPAPPVARDAALFMLAADRDIACLC